ncbi:hypothetical protein M3Y98_00440000 [Aphelenchoides besseyi]|nr:hypothetical protein M3Y98_00440000 [Aphelenchoides besseyi]
MLLENRSYLFFLPTGALDSENCDLWSHFPVVSDALGWTFQVERVKLFGITFGIENAALEVSQDLRNKLIRLGIILAPCSISGSFWCLHNGTEKTFVVYDRNYDYRFEFPSDLECLKHANQTFCQIRAETPKFSRSYGQNSWILPMSTVFLWFELC